MGGRKMSRLIRFLDNKHGCWSRVDLSDGSPVYISVARTGVRIKQSRLGLFGRELYEEKVLYRLAETCMNLSSHINAYSVPGNMRSPVLRVFTQLALDSSSAKEYMAKLHSLAESDEGTGPDIEPAEETMDSYSFPTCKRCSKATSKSGNYTNMYLSGILDPEEFSNRYGMMCAEHAGDVTRAIMEEEKLTMEDVARANINARRAMDEELSAMGRK